MKNLRSLNNFFFIFLTIIILFTNVSLSNEPTDIWNITKDNSNLDNINEEEKKDDSIYINTSEKTSIKSEFNEEALYASSIELIGLFDPAENDLSIDMWSSSDGDQIMNILNKIFKMKLSRDAKELLKISLLTNAYAPKINISKKEFAKFKVDFLIKNKDLELMQEFIIKNQNAYYVENLIKEYTNQNLLYGNLDKSCDIFKKLQRIFTDPYLDKFKIYCYITEEKKEEAQLYYDLKKELGLKDKFFEEKFNILMGYQKNRSDTISKDSLLNFHLSHRTNENFEFVPNDKTKKFIWKYLSNYNLLEGVTDIDLENVNKIKIIEKATHDGNYSEKELLFLYKRFQFSIDQLINAAESFKLLPRYEGRALLYQKMLLSNEPNEKMLFAEKLKNSFIKDEIGNAFSVELSNELKKIELDNLSSNFSSFYEKNIILDEKKPQKIKFNNKIIHQSKLLNYLSKNFNLEKAEKDTNDILKKVKTNKDYVFSNKDKMLIDSMRYDGVVIKKKYINMYEQSYNIPIDLQVLINNNDVGMILLRLVEILGEDKIDNLGTETLYFIITVLNEVNLDKLRNNILLETLPLKI
tara:strand:+ start:1385 stop:3127 length:1743 start_codon:yes stop_codon:yes gene_type:complete